MLAYIISKYNYWAALILLLIGLFGMIAKNNLFKKVIGMSIFQAAIILFYVSIGHKRGATIPIISHGHGHHDVLETVGSVDLPHGERRQGPRQGDVQGSPNPPSPRPGST